MRTGERIGRRPPNIHASAEKLHYLLPATQRFFAESLANPYKSTLFLKLFCTSKLNQKLFILSTLSLSIVRIEKNVKWTKWTIEN